MADYTDEDILKYIKDKALYEQQRGGAGRFAVSEQYELPCLTDYRENAGDVDPHYFFQDIYVANKVMESGVKSIYDIGSRVDGYISHLLSMGIEVTMIDIRPLPYDIKGLHFLQGNATDLSTINDSSINTMSSLHALEHFGLGRYGDPVCYDGWMKALDAYMRVLCPGGILYLSVPCGRTERVMFNAHRIFAPGTIAEYMLPAMKITEYTFIHNGTITTCIFDENDEDVIEKLDNIRLNEMGEYDCGIFVFQKR